MTCVGTKAGKGKNRRRVADVKLSQGGGTERLKRLSKSVSRQKGKKFYSFHDPVDDACQNAMRPGKANLDSELKLTSGPALPH